MQTKLIYKPKGKAGEYASWALNVYRGCDHNCQYPCYVPSVLHMTKEEFAKPQLREPTESFLSKVRRDCEKLVAEGLYPQVLLSFTCDPYCHFDEEHQVTRHVIQVLHEYGLSVCTLTKGGTRAWRDLDLFTPKDAFATTLTCITESESLEWEPGAELPLDRIKTLEIFYYAGIPTWVSLEPVLNTESALHIIQATHKFVDLFKIGLWNYDQRAKEIDWKKFGNDSVALCESLGVDYLIKEDLRKAMG
jgi:DNA repair photolyase